jgi:prevent-host-death family protein
MHRVSISETKARLSALLDLVRGGEAVVITDRGRPVARLVPAMGRDDDDGRLARLERAGLVRRGPASPPARVIETPPPDLGGSVLELLLEERRAGP